MVKTAVTFGEIMGRIAPPDCQRLEQAIPGQLIWTFGGAEANVAVSLARLGIRSRYVTALPRNALTNACLQSLGQYGVNTNYIVQADKGRMGLYFLETGANQRPSNVVYDRDGSSVSTTAADQYDWKSIFQDAAWLHITRITPAISATAAEATRVAMETAKSRSVTVSCDLNFRKKLWRWDPNHPPAVLAQKTMRQLLPLVDVVIANEEDAAIVLGIHAKETDVAAGQLNVDRYPDVAREIVRQFDNVSHVAITLRESISASHNRWGAMLWDTKRDKPFFAPRNQSGSYSPYEITHIVDRVGAGDSFAAGLIYSLMADDLSEPSRAISFAAAASCLAHSIWGDFNLSSRAEVESLMGGDSSGRVNR